MTKQEFIFSDVRRHRLARHIAFWVVWSLIFFLFFHLPLRAIHGWNLNNANSGIREFGAWWLLKMWVVNVMLAVVVPQMLFTYTLFYYILPRYFYQKRKFFVRAGVVTLFVGIYLIVSGYFMELIRLVHYIIGRKEDSTQWTFNNLFFVALRNALTSLPIVLGLALLIRSLKRWWLKEKEARYMAEEKIKAELQLLKAQVHPHFLFNTLNNIYFFTLTGSSKAPEMIKKLSDLLHYILNECNQPWVPLEKEIKMIKDYIALEKIRYGEQMDLSVELPESLDLGGGPSSGWYVAPLLLIPFVENSFKHGASKMLKQPHIKLRISIENSTLHFFIANDKPLENEGKSLYNHFSKPSGQIGLKNVKKRLQLVYPDQHELNIISEPQNFTVYLNIRLRIKNNISKETEELVKAIVHDRA